MPADLSGLSEDARHALMLGLDEARKQGVSFNVTSAFRSPEAQAALYANRASNPFPVAPPGRSKHEQGLAADVALADEGQRQALTQILAKHGWNWRLGNKDRVHYEYDPSAAAARSPALGESPAAYVTSLPLPKPKKAAGYVTDLPLPSSKKPAGYVTDLPLPAPKQQAAGLVTELPLPSPPTRGRLGQAVPSGFYGGEQVVSPAGSEQNPRHVSVPTGTIPGVPPPGGAAAAISPGQGWSAISEDLVPPPALAKAEHLVGQGLNRAFAVAAPVTDVYNSISAEIGKSGGGKPGPTGSGSPFQEFKDAAALPGAVIRGVLKSHPWKAFVNSAAQGKPLDFSPLGHLQQSDPTVKQILDRAGGAEAWDFALSFPALEVAGMAQGAAVEKLGQAAGAAARTERGVAATAALAKRFPKLAAAFEGRSRYEAAQVIMNRHAAGFDRYLRQSEDAINDAHRTSAKYLKQGVPIRGANPFTQQPTNVFDQLVGEYIDAGNPGSKYEHLNPPSIDPATVKTDAATAEKVHQILQRAKGAKAALFQRQAADAIALSHYKEVTNALKQAPLPQGELAELLGNMKQAARDAVARTTKRGALAAEAESAAEAASRDVLARVLARARKALPDIEAKGQAAAAAKAARRQAELKQIYQVAQQNGIDAGDVIRIGKKYSRTMDALGQHLVDFGLLDADAFQALKGQYLPRLYQKTAGDPRDLESFLKLMEEQGVMTPEAIGQARQRLIQPQAFRPGMGPKAFTQSRKLGTYAERTNREQGIVMSPEATPAFARYATSAARAAGEASGHAEIAQNPIMAVPQEAATPEQLMHWRPFTGKGPLEGHLLHPGVEHYLRIKNDPGLVYKGLVDAGHLRAAHAYQDVSRLMKRIWVSSPKTAVNNATGNYELGSSAAAINGAKYNLKGYAQAVGEIRAARKGGRVAPFLQEALDHTSILRESALEVPRQAISVGAGFGVETAGQRLRQLPGKLGDLYSQNFYNDVEKAGRFYLYKELRQAGKSIPEAEQVVNKAMITYSDVGFLVRQSEKNPLLAAPFITFPTRAITQYLNTAVRRPDKFYTYTGQRLRDTLDKLAERKYEAAGGLPAGGPVARRAAGQDVGGVGPFDLPIPGQIVAGKQQYARSQMFAPILGGVMGNRTGDLFGGVGERLGSAVPIINLARNLYFNRTGPLPDQHPIVPPGSVPPTRAGNLKVGLAYGGEVARAIFPQANDFIRLFQAGAGRPEYESLSSPVPKFGAALLRGITGIKVDETVGENPLERSERVARSLQGVQESEYTHFATDYGRQLIQGMQQHGIAWSPRADFQRIADSYDAGVLTEAVKGASDSLFLTIARDQSEKQERLRKIREKLDWLYSLSVAAAKKGIDQAQFLTPEQRAPYAGLLEENR